ncbi:MAG: UDP-N-acetylmuramoyl-tripeptide--D-alanyl-D-alanine ligase [Eggerthellaceae bacterium]|nr:UDP-N-acetylmuramoyl-tripeptide--D-alanyl-D-alanine ligase [Eggerthellaceae bacterium]
MNDACPKANRQNESQDVPATHVVTGLTWDSRTVKPGDLYVALPGERVDGHDFAAAAVEAGAVAVLGTRELSVDVPVIVAADAMQAVADLAAYWRSRLKGTVIGLTGSTGKTTTKNLVRDVLACAGSVVATKANQNNELGVPATLLSADEDTDFVVVEMGMRGLGQIEALCKIACPDWGLVTNVGESHIELLGSRENIARAKSELLAALPQGGIGFVNAADELLPDLLSFGQAEEHGARIVKFNEDVRAENVSLDEEGRPSFTLTVAADASALPERDSAAGNGDKQVAHASEDKREGNAEASAADVKVKLALRGMHNVSNACSAAAVGLAAGLTLSQCAEALAAAQPEKGRQQVFRTAQGVTVVDDSYNANPDSMRASLATFSALEVPGRHIAVLGDMGELGTFALECHERVGALAGQSNLDLLICVGELSEHIALAATDAGMPDSAVHHLSSVDTAIQELKSLVEPGDAVLVKASHFMEFDRIVEGLVG